MNAQDETQEFPTISMGDVIRHQRMTPAEKAQAKRWTSIKILVYWIEDARGQVLYVGSTKHGLLRRIRKHVRDQSVIGKMIARCPDIAATWSVALFPCDSTEHALGAERRIIAAASPVFNYQYNPGHIYRRACRGLPYEPRAEPRPAPADTGAKAPSMQDILDMFVADFLQIKSKSQ